MKKPLVIVSMFLIIGCSPEQELSSIKAQKAECKKFKIKFDEVQPGNQNLTINGKVNDCKNLGAWD